MTTQAIVSIVKNGHTFIKAVCGCNGYNAEKLAKIIKDNRLDKIRDIYKIALENKFGCIDCLVVMNNDDIIFKGDTEPSSLYREKFDDPSFNPIWKCGTAENVIILKIDESVNNVIEELKNCVFDTDVAIVDDVLEFLHDHKMLNESGEKLKHEFWEKYIKGDKNGKN